MMSLLRARQGDGFPQRHLSGPERAYRPDADETACRCAVAGSSAHNAEERCACGNLLARHVAGGVELKCRRCKRTVIVPLDTTPEESRATRSET